VVTTCNGRTRGGKIDAYTRLSTFTYGLFVVVD
jgi:hypothetical protein